MTTNSNRTILIVIAVMAAVWLALADNGDGAAEYLSAAMLFGVGASAMSSAVLAARRTHGRIRAAMTSLAIGLVGWMMGHVVSTIYRIWLDERLESPSWGGLGYLVLPVAVCAALLLLPFARLNTSPVHLILDGFVVAGCIFLVSWVLVLSPTVSLHDVEPLRFIVRLSHPVLDIVVVTIALSLLVLAESGRRPTYGLVLVGSVVMAISNNGLAHFTVQHTYERGTAVDIGWVVALLCFGLASVESWRSAPATNPTVVVPTRLTTWIPYVPVLGAAVAGTVYLYDPSTVVVLAVAVALICAILIRQFLVNDQNQRLLTFIGHQARIDHLTGLGNRNSFEDSLTQVLVSRRSSQPITVLSLSLDHFRLINEDLGRAAGDLLLIQVADRLSGCNIDFDHIARLGGDEFAVFVDDTVTPSDLARRLQEAFDEPFAIDQGEVMLHLSIGLAVAPAEDACTANSLLERADTAMRIAKSERTGAIRVFDPRAQQPTTATASDAVDASLIARQPARAIGLLRRAIDRRELQMVYQPQYRLPAGEIISAEALVRWPQRDGTLLAPDDFLPLARQNGLMRPLGDLVIEKTFRDAARWRHRGFAMPVAVNMPLPSLVDPGFATRLVATLVAHGLPGAALHIEVTEDFSLADVAKARTVLNTLRQASIKISIDDFGTAYSALTYLRDLPFDQLKLDHKFISPITESPRSAAIVEAIIALAHQLGVAVVAEGVENASTVEQLASYGCDAAQGYYFSPPLPFDDLVRLLTESEAPITENVDGK